MIVLWGNYPSMAELSRLVNYYNLPVTIPAIVCRRYMYYRYRDAARVDQVGRSGNIVGATAMGTKPLWGAGQWNFRGNIMGDIDVGCVWKWRIYTKHLYRIYSIILIWHMMIKIDQASNYRVFSSPSDFQNSHVEEPWIVSDLKMGNFYTPNGMVPWWISQAGSQEFWHCGLLYIYICINYHWFLWIRNQENLEFQVSLGFVRK